MIDVAVIGGGASGFYCAIRIKELAPHLSVAIFEKTGKTLTKVRVSGGGRCNVTHDCYRTSELTSNYPRGGTLLKKVFNNYGVSDFLNWLHNHDVETIVESDGRIFPKSNSSETIAGLFEKLAHQLKIEIYRFHEWQGFEHFNKKIKHQFLNRINSSIVEVESKNVVIAVGGVPDLNKINWKFHFDWIFPVPSLFSFNSNRLDLVKLKPLAGVSVANCKIRITGEKEFFQGPILITHWGISGPAVLKASAWMARRLFEKDYKFNVLISWVGEATEEQIRDTIYLEINKNPRKLWKNNLLFELPSRLWELILKESQIDLQSMCSSYNKKQINKLTENLMRFSIEISGKTTFKEEFVTAGGISIDSIDSNTMAIKSCAGVYACGEILDIDGITGGFNFQGAWSTAEVAARTISNLN